MYEVSSYGRVRRIIRQTRANGYPAVSLAAEGRRPWSVRVHKLVLEAFVFVYPAALAPTCYSGSTRSAAGSPRRGFAAPDSHITRNTRCSALKTTTISSV